jgi:hypothetical protein
VARSRKRVQEAPGVGGGERWVTLRRDGSVALCIAGAPGRRVKIADFGVAVKGAGWERAQVAAQAPLMYEALLDLVSTMREDGSIVHSDGRPYEGHRPGCGCGICSAVLAVALAEGGGRCVLCGCTEFDACAPGCAWEPGTDQLICTAHPPQVIAAAKRFLAAPPRRRT